MGSKKVYIGNLSFDATEDDVAQIFSAFGVVVKISVVTNKDTGDSKGFGFVEMGDDIGASNAIKELNGSEWMGRILKVNEAENKPQKTYAKKEYESVFIPGTKTVYGGNFSFAETQETIRALFQTVGGVKNVKIVHVLNMILLF